MATATIETDTSQPAATSQATAVELFRIPLDLYNRMGDLGLLTTHDRIELLDGLLVKKMTKGPLHSFAATAAMDLLRDRVAGGYYCRSELPIELRLGPGGDSAPEPDLAVVRGTKTNYRTRHPVAADVLLVVEVADSSLREDRKGLRRYACAGIPTVWIVNLRGGNVEVYTRPSGPTDDPGYASKTTRTIGETLELALDDRVVEGLPVVELFE